MAGCPPQVVLRRSLGHFMCMTTSTPNVAVVEIDGIHWRFQKYRCLRNTRAFTMLVRLLGASVLQLLSGRAFAELSQEKKLSTFRNLFLTAKITGGTATDPDEFEAGARELLAYTSDNGGEGVCYSTSPIDPNSGGWVPVRGLETLDSLSGRDLDFFTSYALLWEVVKMNVRPISAGSGTDEGTAPAGSTSSESQTTGAKISSGPNTQSTGNPPPSTRQATGISGG